jgi:hypothetical protein
MSMATSGEEEKSLRNSLIREAKNYPQVLAYNNSSHDLVVIFCARINGLLFLQVIEK